MAFAPSLAKKWYENLSVEELEEKYEDLKKHYCFSSKEEQIDYIIKNYLNASKDVNTNSIKIALEELLKEKTGKEYKIEPKKFEIKLLDIINYITNPSVDPFWTTTLTNYFEKLNDISEADKIRFLIELIQDKNSYNDFTKEIIQNQNAKEIYEKYKKIAIQFISLNSKIG